MDEEKTRKFAMQRVAYDKAAKRMEKALFDIRKFLEDMQAT